MSDANDDGPRLIRPIPRRPFNLNLTSPTPPEEDDLTLYGNPQQQQEEQQSQQHPTNVLNLDSLNSRLLDPVRHSSNRNNYVELGTPGSNEESGPGSATISRAESIMNLTSSTLFGIYSTFGHDRADRGPYTYYNPGAEDEDADADADQDSDRADDEEEMPLTPWGTGAKMLSEDDPYYELHRERTRRRTATSSSLPLVPPRPLTRAEVVVYLGLRAALLFGLGMLYGAIVARVQDGQLQMGTMDSTGNSNNRMEQSMSLDWRYLMFWGVSGVLLGGLLPWFDGVWEGAFGTDEKQLAGVGARRSSTVGAAGPKDAAAGTETDWALVIRGIGAFAGIVYAIRKLPWASTLQVSLTLALANPFLWYLIDRSKPGFLLSAAVGVTGSAILMGLKPDIIPAPMAAGRSSPSSSFGTAYTATRGNSSSSSNDNPLGSSPLVLGGLASQETLETGIWVLSVLFCCCVFFGNIGRRMALNRSTGGKGRWAQR